MLRGALILLCLYGLLACARAIASSGTDDLVSQAIVALSEPNEAQNVQAAPSSFGTKAPEDEIKPLWPLDGIDIAVFAVCMVCLSLAGGAGIGGGAVIIPLFLLVRGWPAATAVAMSNVTILGGSLANFICNITRHRPDGTRTINWDLILMMEPTTIAGAILGAVLNKLLPSYIITYLLTTLLTFMALRLYRKGCETYAKETTMLREAKHAAKAAARAQHQHAPSHPEQQGLTGPSIDKSDTHLVNRTDSGSTRSLRRSGSSISRSFSRFRGPVLVAVGTPNSISGSPFSARHPLRLARTNVAASLPTGVSGGSDIINALEPASRVYRTISSPTGAAAAAVVTPVASDSPRSPNQPGSATARRASWLSNGLRQSFREVSNAYETIALWQGDADAVEPVVALFFDPDTLSSLSDEDIFNSEEDLERGADNADDDDLNRPLLAGYPAGAPGYPDNDVARHGQTLATVVSDDLATTASTDQEAYGPAEKAPLQGKALPGSTVDHTPVAAAGKQVHQEPWLPLPHFATLLALSGWVVAADLAQANTRCGSWQYWVITLSVLAPVVIILLVFRRILLKEYRHDDLAHDAELPEGQLRWTATTTLLYPAICSLAGLIAGLFGIGGGVVKGPLMLELGVPPDVAAATSATMIMFTAGSACVVYSRFGKILPDYGIVFASMGFLFTLGSQLLTFVLIKLLGRRSIIVFMMVVLMSTACCIMYVQSYWETELLIHHPEELTHFGHLCAPGTE